MIEDLIRQVNRLQAQVDALVKPEVPIVATRPLFSAYLSAATSNDKTGDGTFYTVICDTEIFDRNSNYNNATGVFTAPVTGKYLLIGNVLTTNIAAAHSGGNINITTSNRLYRSNYIHPGNVAYATFVGFNIITIADMDAADTATMNIFVTGSTKTVGIYGHTTFFYTFFQGYLLI